MTESDLKKHGWTKDGDGWLLRGAHIRLTAAGKRNRGVTFEDAVKIQTKLSSWWEERNIRGTSG